MENSFEKRGEKIHTKEEILSVLARLEVPADATVERELSDEQGITMFDVTIEGKNEGETIGYEYIRKGGHSGGSSHNGTLVTGIDVVYYENGIPTGGDRVAEYDEQTGEWKML
jgi:hypothetical protein